VKKCRVCEMEWAEHDDRYADDCHGLSITSGKIRCGILSMPHCHHMKGNENEWNTQTDDDRPRGDDSR